MNTSLERVAFGIGMQLRHCGEAIASLLRERRIDVGPQGYVELDIMLMCMVDLSLGGSGRFSVVNREGVLDEVVRAHVSFGKDLALAAGVQSLALRGVPDALGWRLFKSEFMKARRAYVDFLHAPLRQKMLGEAPDWLAVLLFFVGRLRSLDAVSEEGLETLMQESLMLQIEGVIQTFLGGVRGARIELSLAESP